MTFSHLSVCFIVTRKFVVAIAMPVAAIPPVLAYVCFHYPVKFPLYQHSNSVCVLICQGVHVLFFSFFFIVLAQFSDMEKSSGNSVSAEQPLIVHDQSHFRESNTWEKIIVAGSPEDKLITHHNLASYGMEGEHSGNSICFGFSEDGRRPF